jgi:hypothetical protein
VEWSGVDRHDHRLPSGIYYCRLRAGNAIEQRRLTIVR